MIRFPRCLLFAIALTSLVSESTFAVLMGATTAPKQATISVEDGRTIHIRWIVSTSPAHSTGVFSAQATLKDSTTDTLLKTIESQLNVAEGAGPFQFEETLTLSPDEVKQWYELGYSKLVLKRAFTTAGDNPSSSEANLWLRIINKQSNGSVSRSTGLMVHNVDLRFKPQRFKKQVPQNLPLQAQLTVQYSGEGKFTGAWQIAQLGAEGSDVIYKPLATATKQLKHQQSGYLFSPKLPTQTPGRYVLRLCTHNQVPSANPISATENQCPNPELSASLQYEVVAPDAPPTTTPEVATLSAAAELHWQPIENATVYELQLRQVSANETIQSSKFVARMLIACDQTHTTFSNDILEIMLPGSKYQWQISALDQHGDLIRQTAPLYFIFMP